MPIENVIYLLALGFSKLALEPRSLAQFKYSLSRIIMIFFFRSIFSLRNSVRFHV